MAEVQAENRRLTEPLQKAHDQVSDLQRQLASYEKDKVLLAVRSFFCLTVLLWSNCALFNYFLNLPFQVNKGPLEGTGRDPSEPCMGTRGPIATFRIRKLGNHMQHV
jgi:hypothetical protein